MPSAHHLLLLSTLLLSTACGTATYTDDRVYGTWIEALDGTQVEFRTDGTVSWGDEEGTFAFVRSTNWAVCMGMGGCDDGQIRINLNNKSYRISIYKEHFDSHPDRFNIFPRNGTGYPTNIPFNHRDVSGFTLYREGSINGDLMPSDYAEISQGLPEQERYSRYVSAARSLGDGAIAKIDMGIHRYDSDSETWIEIDEDGWGYHMPTPSGIILNTTDQDDITMSHDAGHSWEHVPSLEQDNRIETIIINDTLLHILAEYDNASNRYTDIEFWTLDLNNPQQGWIQSAGSPQFSVSNVHYNLREVGILAIESYDSGTAETHISNDFGASWHPLTDPCQGRIQLHSNGFHCVNDSGTVSRFDNSSMSWSEIDVGYALTSSSYPMSAPQTDDIHFIHNDTLYQWTEEEGSAPIAALSSNITDHVGGVHVLHDRILVHKIGLWNHWK